MVLRFPTTRLFCKQRLCFLRKIRFIRDSVWWPNRGIRKKLALSLVPLKKLTNTILVLMIETSFLYHSFGVRDVVGTRCEYKGNIATPTPCSRMEQESDRYKPCLLAPAVAISSWRTNAINAPLAIGTAGKRFLGYWKASPIPIKADAL